MSKFKLPESVGQTYNVAGVQHCMITRSFPDACFYTHDQLIQALTDLGDEIAWRFSSLSSDHELVIKHIVQELLA